jgi:hypothetical protein
LDGSESADELIARPRKRFKGIIIILSTIHNINSAFL